MIKKAAITIKEAVIKKAVQHQQLLIKSNLCWPFGWFNRFYYRLGAKIAISVFRQFAAVKAIYLMNSFVSTNWVPWVSDVDLMLIIKDMDINEEMAFLNRFWRIYNILIFPFPFIKHIDLFKAEEFKTLTLYNETELSYLELIYGLDYIGNINCGAQNIYSFPVCEWMRLTRWFYKDNFKGRMYIRKYYKIFNKVLRFSDNGDINAGNLRELLSCAEILNLWLSAPEEFVLKGLFYSICVFNGLYKKLDNQQISTVKFQPVVDYGIEEKYPAEKIRVFIESLKVVRSYIKSILVTPRSIQSDKYTIWIIIQDDIQQKNFVDLISLIKTNARAFLENNIFPYVLTENILNLFLTTQRLWIFESFHLSRHAKIIFGENILDRLRRPSDEYIIKMVRSSILVYKNGLRNLANSQNPNGYLKYLLKILSCKLLLEKNIIVTTIDELVNAYDEYYDKKEIDLLIKSLRKERIDKTQAYYILRSTLDNLIRRAFPN